MKLIIKDNYDEMSLWAAQHIADAINNHKGEGPFVLGLPTGSSPLGVYKNLIEMNQAGTVSFKNVVTFNMDEYVGLPKEHEQSYWYFILHPNGIIACDEAACGELKVDTYKYFKEIYKNEK